MLKFVFNDISTIATSKNLPEIKYCSFGLRVARYELVSRNSQLVTKFTATANFLSF
jgi:hypothetical protein